MAWDDKRPMSPHLQIYRLPLTAILSITHRATGAVLFAGLLLMILVLFSAANGPESWHSMQGFLSSVIGKIILFGFTFALFYHFSNGIRHLFWDFGKGFELQTARKTGVAVIIVSIILTALVWIIALLA